MTGDHLFDNVRPWLARPVDERIAFIRSARWIGTPQARAAHAMMQDLLVRSPSLRTTVGGCEFQAPQKCLRLINV